MAKHRIRDIWFLSHSQCWESQVWPNPCLIQLLTILLHREITPTSLHLPPQKAESEKGGSFWRVVPGNRWEEREGQQDRGKANMRCVPAASVVGLIPSSQTLGVACGTHLSIAHLKDGRGSVSPPALSPAGQGSPKVFSLSHYHPYLVRGAPGQNVGEALSGTPGLSSCHSSDWGCEAGHRGLPEHTSFYHLVQSSPLSRKPHALSVLCAGPGLNTFHASVYPYLATPDWASPGIIPRLHCENRGPGWWDDSLLVCGVVGTGTPALTQPWGLLLGAARLTNHGSFPRAGQAPAPGLVLIRGTRPEIQPGTGWRLIISLYPPSCLALNKYLLTDWLILALLPSFPGPLL